MVWEVRPDSSYMLLGGTDYPAEYYVAGWLSFYTLRGTDHRLLSPIPTGWESHSSGDLADLLEQAAPRLSPKGAERPAKPVEEIATLGVVRAFVHPAGRPWTAHIAASEAGGHAVLRFMSGDRSLDLTDWPPDWADLPDGLLADLLRRVPRSSPPGGPETPRRRWNDPPP